MSRKIVDHIDRKAYLSAYFAVPATAQDVRIRLGRPPKSARNYGIIPFVLRRHPARSSGSRTCPRATFVGFNSSGPDPPHQFTPCCQCEMRTGAFPFPTRCLVPPCDGLSRLLHRKPARGAGLLSVGFKAGDGKVRIPIARETVSRDEFLRSMRVRLGWSAIAPAPHSKATER